MWNKFQSSNSSFWSNGSLFDEDIDILTGEKYENKEAELLKLAGYRRAIGNFVNIVTGQSIPVQFNNNDQSYTDGKKVVISGKINEKDFDSAVGLALHEGSHVKLTDFDTLKKMETKFSDQLVTDIAIKYFNLNTHLADESISAETMAANITYVKDRARHYIQSHVGQLMNIVEDRRIDNYIFKSAPGYKGYYNALYERYFHSSSVDKGLQSGEYRTSEWNSYMFRLINITNKNRDLNALPNLLQIWNVLDLKNISRLQTSWMALDVAIEIFSIIESDLMVDEEGGDSDSKGSQDNPNSGEEEEGSSEDVMGSFDENGDAKDDGSKAEGEEANLGQGNLTPNQPQPEMMSPRQKKMLDNAIKKQEDFLNGDIKKSKLTNADSNKMKTLEKSGAELKSVGDGVQSYDTWGRTQKATQMLVIKKMSQDLVESGCFGFTQRYQRELRAIQYDHGYGMASDDHVNKGIVLGKLLGKKLQVRGDVSTIKYSRLDSGKIDKRLIASLGYGAERIFSQTMINQYNPAYLHISIDASGSMSGSKWENSVTSAVAIAQAASMTQNVDVTISIRGSVAERGDMPAVIVVYNSKVDKMTSIRKWMKYFGPCGLTPEGLCFEAIQDLIVDGSNSVDSYFLNFSDGAPYWSGGIGNQSYYYGGDSACKHTAAQIKKMKERGIKIISYFIESTGANMNTQFKMCYGKDANLIDTNNVAQLAKTMNNKFLEK
tara:strand:- start:57 stop:2207 length:2151 start_codon:yes stop_codon:yes gene_type:complete